MGGILGDDELGDFLLGGDDSTYAITGSGGVKMNNFPFTKRIVATVPTGKVASDQFNFPLTVRLPGITDPIYFTDQNYIALPFEERDSHTWIVKVTVTASSPTKVYCFHD